MTIRFCIATFFVHILFARTTSHRHDKISDAMSQIEITQISPEEHDAFEGMFNKLCSEILDLCRIHDSVALDWHALTKTYADDEAWAKEKNSSKKQRRETSVYRSSSAVL